jgi:hypothetical protein
MGNTIWVGIRDQAKDDLPQDNSIMLRMEKELDRLAKKLKVVKLSKFYDYSELEVEFGDLEDDEEFEIVEREGVWFDPGPALAAVKAIRAHLAQHPEDLGFKPDASRQHWPKDLMAELNYCEAMLSDAMARGKEFRFLIVS